MSCQCLTIVLIELVIDENFQNKFTWIASNLSSPDAGSIARTVWVTLRMTMTTSALSAVLGRRRQPADPHT